MATQSSDKEDLENSLTRLGKIGTKFIERLYEKEPIPRAAGENPDKALLKNMNKIAEEVSSSPYSAAVLRDGKLFIVQNSDFWKGDKANALTIDKIRDSEAFKALNLRDDAEIQIITYDQAKGNHPDTVAIEAAIRRAGGARGQDSYLGLAAFNEDGSLNSQEPASCSSCGAVIKALNDNGYQFKVLTSTPINFPSNKIFLIPPFISEDQRLLDSYLDNINNSLQKLRATLYTPDVENLYVQYSTQNDKKNIMQDKGLDDESRNLLIRNLEDAARKGYQKYIENPLIATQLVKDSFKKFEEALDNYRGLAKDARLNTLKLYSPERIEEIAQDRLSKQVEIRTQYETAQRFSDRYTPKLEENILKAYDLNQKIEQLKKHEQITRDQLQQNEGMRDNANKKLQELQALIQKSDFEQAAANAARDRVAKLRGDKANSSKITEAESAARSARDRAKKTENEYNAERDKPEYVEARARLEAYRINLPNIQARHREIAEEIRALEPERKRLNDLIINTRKAEAAVATKGEELEYINQVVVLKEANDAKRALSGQAHSSSHKKDSHDRDDGSQDKDKGSSGKGQSASKDQDSRADSASRSSEEAASGKSSGGKHGKDRDDSVEASEALLASEQQTRILGNNYYAPEDFASLANTKNIAVVNSNSVGTVDLMDKDIVVFNVNALSGKLSSDSNHWVGVIVDRENNTAIYIDPLGKDMDEQLKIITRHSILKDCKIVSLYDSKNHPQFFEIETHKGSEKDVRVIKGNDKDCGPMLADALQRLSNVDDANKLGVYRELQDEAGKIKSGDQSREHGQLLRAKHASLISESMEISRESLDQLHDKADAIVSSMRAFIPTASSLNAQKQKEDIKQGGNTALESKSESKTPTKPLLTRSQNFK